MPTYTQDTRPIAVETPLGKDALLLTAFSGAEEMSRLFHYELEMVSEKESIAPKDIVGKKVDFWVDFPDGQHRHFNGIVKRFVYCGTGDRLSTYRAEVVPWLWFLTRTSDCRIFQNKSVPDIIQQVFKDLGFTDFKPDLKGTHTPWEYCVQYRETDFNFVSRLMEEEGIFYFFKHEKGKHTLVLGDAVSAYEDCQDKEVQFAAVASAPESTDQIRSWEHQYEFRSGKWVHTDYNFTKPTTSLLADTKGMGALSDSSKFEFFDFPADIEEKAESTNNVKLRMEQEEAGYDVVHGESYCRSFSPGGKFTIKKHANKGEAGKSYVLTAVRHEARVSGTFVGGTGADAWVYNNSFLCIPSSVPFRPERLSMKPVVHGVHTAVVTGPSGEEIYCDKYGRVKVQFHWDREGKKDDKSSCWIRCAQTAAGKGWGMMMLPRIGQEVVVTYLEGDPDRPLITGCVYNESQMPAYGLPDDRTKTSFKSNSSPGGSGFNEVRFEDKAGEEQFYLHAQKDMDMLVLNDQRINIEHDQSLTVANDCMESVGNDKHVTIGGNHTESVSTDVTVSIGGEQHVKIDKNLAEDIGEDLSLKVGGSVKQNVTNSWSLKTKKINAKAESSLALEANKIHIKGSMIVIDADVKLSLKVGGNFVDVSPAGVAVNGTMLLLNSGGAAGSGDGCTPEDPDSAKKAEPKKPIECDKTAKTGSKSAS
jgi:type VI secretion system secreted protein VgrG